MSRPKLLLADDSVTIRKVVELTFADEGVDVTTVADAESAMLRFVEIHPDIVLVDVGLDGTSGYQICEMIKLDEATNHIPVLLLVGSFEPFDQDEAERVGADGFLTKPFHSIRDLVARVDDLLGRNSDSPVLDETADLVDTLEQLPTEEAASEITPETVDIENLYRSSFAETVEIDEFDTVEDLLDDPALDDEMIETSFPGGAPAEDLNGLIPTADLTEPTKEFDWSSEAIVTGNVADASHGKFEPKFVFDESLGEVEETVEEHCEPPSETPDPEVSDESELEAAVETSAEQIQEQILEPATQMAPEIEMPDAIADPALDSEAPIASEKLNMSPEFITAVAQKVLESLSDRVVREVAKEAVPQIAEKLIREALDGTNTD
ncbi:MAG: response regulator [Pyrinomonadaceae bacterium]